MGRWGSRCSSGRRTRAKSRFFWSAIWRALDREPFLIVPNRSDVERVERDLLRRTGALLGGSIGTFDDLFERIARATEARGPCWRTRSAALLCGASSATRR